MTDWRYWITYSGKVKADTEDAAKVAAIIAVQDDIENMTQTHVADLEVEEIENA